MQTKNNTKKIILLAAFMSAAASFALYLPSLGFEFVNWDDHLYVYENPDIRSFGLKQALTGFVNAAWVPLTLLSFTIDYALWGLDPFGYHLTNSVLHAANSFLVALLAARLAAVRGGLGTRAVFVIALSAGLLFGLHPLRVESVAWVTERKDVLNAFFFLLGLHAYLNYVQARKASSYVLTLVFFVLSLLSKPMTITMPLVLLILDYYPLGRSARDGWRRLIIEKTPFLAVSMAVGILNIWSHNVTSVIVSTEALPLHVRFHVAARGYLFYIYKTFFPVKLAPLYPIGAKWGIDLLFSLYLLALSAITALALYLRKWSKAFISAWAYFIITLFPVIGLLQAGSQAAADRFTYLPGVSLVILAAAGAGWAVMRSKKAFPSVFVSVIALSAVLSLLTFRQAAVWKDSIALWDHQISLYPDHHRGYILRGNTYLGMELFELAIRDLDRALEIEPGSIEAYSIRGSTFINVGRFEEGLADLTMVVAEDPGNKAAYMDRGTAYAVAGRYRKALKDFLKAAKLDPSDASTHIEIGKVYMHLGDIRKSYLNMKKALDLGDSRASRFLKAIKSGAQVTRKNGSRTGDRR